MDDDPDPRLQLLEALRLHSEENAADVAAFDARCLDVAQQCVDLWHRLWLDASIAVAIDSALEIKFRICFPLAAHALNHIDAALGLHQQRPWVAASSTRVAFEHALAAQWVLLTDDGERELVNWMKGQHHKRGKELADALSRLASEPGASALSLDQFQPRVLVGEESDASGWSVANACSRFADTKLFYDIYRNLSQAEHPSLGLISTHLAVGPAGVQNNLSAAGALNPSGEVPRALVLQQQFVIYGLW